MSSGNVARYRSGVSPARARLVRSFSAVRRCIAASTMPSGRRGACAERPTPRNSNINKPAVLKVRTGIFRSKPSAVKDINGKTAKSQMAAQSPVRRRLKQYDATLLATPLLLARRARSRTAWLRQVAASDRSNRTMRAAPDLSRWSSVQLDMRCSAASSAAIALASHSVIVLIFAIGAPLVHAVGGANICVAHIKIRFHLSATQP